MKTYSIILIIIFIILQVLDGWTTVLFLRNPNLREWNRPLAWLMEKIGIIPALILFKGATAGVLFFALWNYPYWQVQVTVGVVCIIYGFATVRNYGKL